MTRRTERWPAGTPCWTDLTASDPDRTREFYRRVLGWEYSEPEPEFGGYCHALLDGGPVAGLSPSVPDLEGVPHVWQVHLATDRIDLGAERILSAGGTQLVDPTRMGRFGTMGVFQDPTGATFGLWEAGELIGFTAVDEPGSVVWCDLTTPDPAGARDFYAQVFGYSYEETGAMGPSYAAFTVPGGERYGGGIGGTDPETENAVAVWSVCFRAEDLDETLQHVRDAGGAVMEGPMRSPYGRLAVVAGPDRESFAVMTPGEPG